MPESKTMPVTAAPGIKREPGLWRRAAADGRFWLGLVLAGLPIAVALVGPWVAPIPPTQFVSPPFSPPDQAALFGTDTLGRDIFSRFLAGGQTLLILSTLATLLGVTLGAVLGGLLATMRGVVDEIAMRLADVALAFPAVVLALMCLSLIGPKLWLIVLVVALGHLPRTLRVIRSAAMSIAERDFVRYAEALGVGRIRTVATEIMPNVVAPLMVEYGIRFTYSVGLIASLSFLGLGVQPPSPDWGNMINENRLGITIQPWGVVLPLLALALLAIGCNLITECIGRAMSFIEARRGK